MLHSSANNIHKFSVQISNIKEGCTYMKQSLSTWKEGSGSPTPGSMKMQNLICLMFFGLLSECQRPH
jgi:hypothetical protein